LGRLLAECVEAAVDGGVTMVQLREKTASTREFYDVGVELRRVTHARNIPLVVDDRVDVALAIGADGVHLGQSDMPIAAARRIAGSRLFIGITARSAAEAKDAEAAGADYIGAGAVFATSTKTDTGAAIGVDGIAKICAAVHIPVVAIGGVKPEHTAALVKAGAAGVAVVSGILSRNDVAAAARSYYA
jgi:thiamine-phosphate pyrophosphorylase